MSTRETWPLTKKTLSKIIPAYINVEYYIEQIGCSWFGMMNYVGCYCEVHLWTARGKEEIVSPDYYYRDHSGSKTQIQDRALQHVIGELMHRYS